MDFWSLLPKPLSSLPAIYFNLSDSASSPLFLFSLSQFTSLPHCVLPPVYSFLPESSSSVPAAFPFSLAELSSLGLRCY